MIINRDSLTQAGFSFYKMPHGSLFQKRIKDSDGTTLYFITIKVVDFADLRAPKEVAELNGLRPEVHLFTCEEWDPKHLIVIQFGLTHEMTVAQLEAHILRIYTDLRCIPDPHN